MIGRLSRLHTIGIFIVSIILLVGAANYFGALKYLRLTIISFEKMLYSTFENKVIDTSSNQVITLLHEINRLKLLEIENRRLRELLNFQTNYKYPLIVANVMSFDPYISTMLYIDKGYNDGLMIGQPVISGNGIIVGKISRTSNDSSVVELLTSNSSRLAVTNFGSEQTIGLLYGYLSNTMKIEYVDQSININPDDVVVTSGIEPLIPQGLLVGKVKGKVSSTDDLFQSIIIDPIVKYDNLRIVSVIKVL